MTASLLHRHSRVFDRLRTGTCWTRLLFGLLAASLSDLEAEESPDQPQAFEVGPANADLLPRGKEADGILGDFVLRNRHIELVVSQNAPLRRANMSTFYGTNGITPGCLYDLT
ncbi:MAG: hypothetical protein ACKO3H_15940, partial [Verrucomicrobiota bacterium]